MQCKEDNSLVEALQKFHDFARHKPSNVEDPAEKPSLGF